MGVAHTQMNLYIAPFKKALIECLLCYRCYLLTQRFFVACANDYLVKPSWTATAQATQFTEPKKHLFRCFWVLVLLCLRKDFSFACANDYLVSPSCTATAQATEAPTIGLLPIPISPIISTCAGTDEEPANCASECILPIVSVIP